MTSRWRERWTLASRAAATTLRRRRNASDLGRWSDLANLHPDWDARTARLAALVPPGSAVIEFGAGRRALEALLPAGCAYTPSDLVERGPGTIVCDLNAELPELAGFEVAVFSGVLEYVNDVPRLVRHLARTIDIIVASYATTDVDGQRTLVARRRHGWVNEYSAAGFEAVFEREGYRRDAIGEWTSQSLYRFMRSAPR